MFGYERDIPVDDTALGETSKGMRVTDDFYSIVKPNLDLDNDGLISLPDIILFCKRKLPSVSEKDVTEVCLL